MDCDRLWPSRDFHEGILTSYQRGNRLAIVPGRAGEHGEVRMRRLTLSIRE